MGQKSNKEGFMQAIKRLLTNKLFMYNFMSNVFFAFAFMGFGTFMPKFFELNFRRKRSSSAGFVGGIGTMSKGIGFLISGQYHIFKGNIGTAATILMLFPNN